MYVVTISIYIITYYSIIEDITENLKVVGVKALDSIERVRYDF